MGEVDRRDFLKGAGLVGATAVAPSEANALAPRDGSVMAREPTKRLPDAVGMLYDSALCIGCKACVAACKSANEMPPETPPSLLAWNEHTWDTAEDLSGRTLNVIKVYRNGTAEGRTARSTASPSSSGIACTASIPPACRCVRSPRCARIRSPASSLNDPDACIGCRYCVYACPFGVPQYRFQQPVRQDQQVPDVQSSAEAGQDSGLLRRLPDRRVAVRQGHRLAARRSSGASPPRPAAPTPSRAAASATIVRPTRRRSRPT